MDTMAYPAVVFVIMKGFRRNTPTIWLAAAGFLKRPENQYPILIAHILLEWRIIWFDEKEHKSQIFTFSVFAATTNLMWRREGGNYGK